MPLTWDDPQRAPSTGFWLDEDTEAETEEVPCDDEPLSPQELARFSSATPNQSEDETFPLENSFGEELLTPAPTQTFIPRPDESALFTRIRAQIYLENGIRDDGSPLSVAPQDARAIEAQHSHAPFVPIPAHRLFRAQVDKSLIDAFVWARQFQARDEGRILEEIRDTLASESTAPRPEWERQPSGARGIIHAELNYEGAGEQGDDGIHIHSESEALRPFDRDYRVGRY